MPSKKKNTRAAQLQPTPQPAQSDYETDTQNPTDVHPSTVPARSVTELNSLVLKRYVPNIERIISIAPFAVVYLFSPETQQWEKSGTEGTLFVCQLSGDQFPRYSVVILNRKSLDNFIVELVSGEDIEITEQYVILQMVGDDGTPNIYGLWIFSEEEGTPSVREVVANAIQECAVRAEIARGSMNGNHEEDYSQSAPYGLDGAADSSVEQQSVLLTPMPSSGEPVDLLSLFNKQSIPPQGPPQNQLQGQAAHQHSHPQAARFTPTADNDFFRSSQSPAAPQQQQTQPPPQQNVLLDLFKSAQKG